MRYVAIVFGLCFVLSAFVQLNDPDPVIWVTLYAIPAILSFWFVKKKQPALIYFAIAVVYLTMAILQWPPEFEGFLFGEVKTMRSLNIELARESFGLGFVAVAMLVLGLNSQLSQKK